ncbi:MAG TPA: deoxyuridine 5'-triphosphate nucleotidohydrolase [Geobacterales bacterium]|nr:deoxyuridine 5'-triphosphate nucleotidohydrolase [Geobacterales bacterium]
MAVLSVEELKKYITCELGMDEKQYQINGIDLRIDKVYKFVSFGSVFIEEVKLPPLEELKVEGLEGKQLYVLDKGSYVIEFFETIEVPSDAVGICFPRSSLLRAGCDLRTALWDSGYKGKSRALLVVHNPIVIEKGARVAQIIFIRTEKKADKTYSGKYQFEGIKK